MKKLLIIFFSLFMWAGHICAQSSDIEYHSLFEKNILNHFIQGVEVNNLQLQLVADATVLDSDVNQYELIYNDIISVASEKKESLNSDQKFLSWLFYKVHRKTLKNYQQFSSLSDLFKKGSYDCLSATTLYALLLNDLGFKSEVIETNYHIYLEVITDQGRFLIESTDPLNGFVYNKKEIEIRLQDYVKNNSNYNSVNNQNTFAFTASINDKVSLTKLVGLQYYNEAVNNFNNGEMIKTVYLLEKSTIFYHSDRITEFGMLLAQTLKEDDSIDSDYKEKVLNRVSQFIQTASSSVASR